MNLCKGIRVMILISGLRSHAGGPSHGQPPGQPRCGSAPNLRKCIRAMILISGLRSHAGGHRPTRGLRSGRGPGPGANSGATDCTRRSGITRPCPDD